MPLIKPNLEAGIKAALIKAANKKSKSDKPEDALNEIAADIATAIDTYIRAATIVTPSGPGTIQ